MPNVHCGTVCKHGLARSRHRLMQHGSGRGSTTRANGDAEERTEPSGRLSTWIAPKSVAEATTPAVAPQALASDGSTMPRTSDTAQAKDQRDGGHGDQPVEQVLRPQGRVQALEQLQVGRRQREERRLQVHDAQADGPQREAAAQAEGHGPAGQADEAQRRPQASRPNPEEPQARPPGRPRRPSRSSSRRALPLPEPQGAQRQGEERHLHEQAQAQQHAPGRRRRGAARARRTSCCPWGADYGTRRRPPLSLGAAGGSEIQ